MSDSVLPHLPAYPAPGLISPPLLHSSQAISSVMPTASPQESSSQLTSIPLSLVQRCVPASIRLRITEACNALNQNYTGIRRAETPELNDDSLLLTLNQTEISKTDCLQSSRRTVRVPACTPATSTSVSEVRTSLPPTQGKNVTVTLRLRQDLVPLHDQENFPINSTEVALSEVKGNVLLLIHQLVITGHLAIRETSVFLQLQQVLRSGQLAQYPRLLCEALEGGAARARVILAGNILSSDRTSDLSFLILLELLGNLGIDYQLLPGKEDLAAYQQWISNTQHSVVGTDAHIRELLTHTVWPYLNLLLPGVDGVSLYSHGMLSVQHMDELATCMKEIIHHHEHNISPDDAWLDTVIYINRGFISLLFSLNLNDTFIPHPENWQKIVSCLADTNPDEDKQDLWSLLKKALSGQPNVLVLSPVEEKISPSIPAHQHEYFEIGGAGGDKAEERIIRQVWLAGPLTLKHITPLLWRIISHEETMLQSIVLATLAQVSSPSALLALLQEPDNNHYTLLAAAMSSGSVNAVRFLGFLLDIARPTPFALVSLLTGAGSVTPPPLWQAMKNNHPAATEAFIALMDNLPDLLKTRVVLKSSSEGYTALMIAIQNKHTNSLKAFGKLLLTLPPKYQYNILTQTMSEGDSAIWTLTGHGCQRTTEAFTELTRMLDEEQLYQLLSQLRADSISTLMLAMAQNRPLSVLSFGKMLYRLSMDNQLRLLNQPGINGFTPLWFGMQEGSAGALRAFGKLTDHLNVEQRYRLLSYTSSGGYTPMTIALMCNHPETIAIFGDLMRPLDDRRAVQLLKQGTNDDLTVLMLASIKNEPEVVRAIFRLMGRFSVEKQLELLNQRTPSGFTALKFAHYQHFARVVRTLQTLHASVIDATPGIELVFREKLSTAIIQNDLSAVKTLCLYLSGHCHRAAWQIRGLWVANESAKQRLQTDPVISKVYADAVRITELPPGIINLLLKQRPSPLWRPSPHSMKLLAGEEALLEISKRLNADENTKLFFAPILTLQKQGNITYKTPVVSGDTDGSTARMVLLGIQAGMIALTSVGCDMLAEMMGLEFHNGVDLVAFQQNSHAQELAGLLVNEIIIQPGHHPLIFLGDVAHDRLSCNKDADRLIRESLKACGAVFILGNHDCYIARQSGLNKLLSETDRTTWGGLALDSGDAEIWKSHEEYVFVHAHWDAASNTLFTHNGVIILDQKSLVTGFGMLPELPDHSATRTLADIINAMTWSGDELALDQLTGFRPLMLSDGMQQLEYMAGYYGIRQVYGHDGEYLRTGSRTIGLNSRRAGKMIVSAVLLGINENPLYQQVSSIQTIKPDNK